jgi:hypothetical protein
MPRLYPSLIINLIGSNKHVSIAKNEIREYVFDKYFSFKEVENKYLEQELQRDCLTKDLYINPCYWISCNEIKNIHDVMNDHNYHKNIYSYALLVTNTNTEENDIINCKYIHDIYNIKNPLKEKESLLFSILFSDYSRFKFH